MHLSTVTTTFPQSVTDMFYELTHNGREHSWIDTNAISALLTLHPLTVTLGLPYYMHVVVV